MLYRPTTESDLPEVLGCAPEPPFDRVGAEVYRAGLATGAYRPEHTWVAVDGGRVVARAVWWASGAGRPEVLDCLWVDPAVPDPAGVGAELLRAAHTRFGAAPEYQLLVAPKAAARVGWRRAAAAGAGLTAELERLRFEWRVGAGVPAPSGALSFAPGTDDVFRELFAAVAVGSLDDFTRRDVARCGVSAHARESLDYYRSLPGSRSWWRVARTTEGRLAGFVIPSANDGGPVVGYLGVLPGLRGSGLAAELVAEATRSHAARGADRVRADTDSLNTPMAAAFTRVGYQVTAARLVLSSDSSDSSDAFGQSGPSGS